MKELRQTAEYAKYMQLIDWHVQNVKSVYVYAKKIPLLGWFIKIQRPPRILEQKDLVSVLSGKRLFMLDIEALTEKQSEFFKDNYGYKAIKSTSLPSKTIRIDLKKSEPKLLKELHSKTRYNIKIAEKKGVTIEESEDIDQFSVFWHSSAKKRGLYFSLEKEIRSIYRAFGRNAQLLYAFLEGELVAAVLLLFTSDGAYYMYAAANEKGKKNYAPTLLTWKSILYAKAKDKKYYDFEGIYDERYPIKSWRGFSRFKKSFGGREIKYPGIIRKYFFPWYNKLK